MIIVLIGYMGSGKTTIGDFLSLFLEYKFFDLDKMIFTWKNHYIHNMFYKNGENYFRNIEKKVLYFLKNIRQKSILSTGGGTPCLRDNIISLNRLGITLYLQYNSKESFERLRSKENKRPLILDLSYDNLLDYLHNHHSKRNIYYNISLYKIKIINRFPDEISFSIHNQLNLVDYGICFIKPHK